MTDEEPLDVAVVGAGVAGAYCAYRLAREGERVGVFEAEDRVGGRLWSYRWDQAGTTVELGGEAFAVVHGRVFRLVKHLNLKAEPHAPFNRQLRLYLRDSLFKPADLNDTRNFPGPDGHDPV